MAGKTHHKHHSSKDYRKLLDGIESHPQVHRVATGKVKPRMGSGRPVAIVSKMRRTQAGLSVTINSAGAVIDAYVITSHPAEVEQFLRDKGWA